MSTAVTLIVNKVIMGFVALVAIWNLTKLPYYLGFNNDGNETYNDSTGVELSINLGHWFDGYRSVKMRTPACNFILVHCTVGITILSMSVMAMTNRNFRKNYCVPFFAFTIFHSFQTAPASWINDAGFMPLFMVACLLQGAMAVWGLQTRKTYDQDPAKADKELHLQYGVITFINAAAAFLEVPNIMKAFGHKNQTGEWNVIKEGPHDLYGNTPYDLFPEKVGVAFFVIFTTCVWFLWPLMLAKVDLLPSKKATKVA